jgi:phage tail-like protein
MANNPVDSRKNQLSGLLDYLPAIFREPPKISASPPASPPLPLGRFLMAFESILLGLPKSKTAEWADLQFQPGIEEILGGAVEQKDTGEREVLLEGIQRYFDPGADYPPCPPGKVEDYNRTPKEFLPWLAGWVALTLRDDWNEERGRAFIANAVPLLYQRRGTKQGVLDIISMYTGWQQVTIVDDPSVVADFAFTVNVHGQDDFENMREIVMALIELQKPAHTSFELFSR